MRGGIMRVAFQSSHAVAHGDCLDILPHLPAGSVDLIVTSPPYPGQKGDVRTVEEWLDWFDCVLAGMRHVLAPNGVLCLNVMFKRTEKLWFDRRVFTSVIPLVESHGFNMIDMAIFHKLNPAPNGSMSRADLPGWEPIYIFTIAPTAQDYYFEKYRKPYAKKSLTAGGDRVYSGNRGKNIKPHTNGAQQSNVFSMSSSGGQNRYKAEGQSFPTELPYRLIQQYCSPNGVVFDPFMGAGTTMRAAQELGRFGYGTEIKLHEVEKAHKWLTEPFQVEMDLLMEVSLYDQL